MAFRCRTWLWVGFHLGKSMSLTLYYHPLASFCHKVLIALYENAIEFEGRIIDLADAADRSELEAVWPLAQFPVIRDHARKRDVPESTVIIEYLDRYFARDGHSLIPREWEAALEVRLWDRFFDNHVQGPMQEIVSDRLQGTGTDMSGQRAMLDTAYEMIDRHMASRDWAAGGDFSMADCAAAPALFYAGTLQPIPETLSQLTAYFDKLVHRPSFARVLQEARPYFPLYPFVDGIPKRFL